MLNLSFADLVVTQISNFVSSPMRAAEMEAYYPLRAGDREHHQNPGKEMISRFYIKSLYEKYFNIIWLNSAQQPELVFS